MKKYLLKIMPARSWAFVAVIVLMNSVTYFGTRVFTAGRKHYSMALPIDKKLPLVPFFILFYILAYAQWIIGFLLIGRDDAETAGRIFLGELIAKSIALFCFVLFPTAMGGLRPDAAPLWDGTVWQRLTAWIYALDAPDNLFPSIHCLESWVCFRGALRLTKTPRWYPFATLVMTLLVFASTVLVRQHVVLDIAGGVLAVEIGVFLADRLPLRFLSKMGGDA